MPRNHRDRNRESSRTGPCLAHRPSIQRVNVGECTAWVQTKLTFDLEMRGPDGTTEIKPYTVDTFREHHGAVEPTLYLTPSGKWVRRSGVAGITQSQAKARPLG